MVHVLQSLVGMLAKLAVPSALFVVGLTSARFDLEYLRSHRGLWLRSLLATLVLIPLLMIGVASLLPVPLSVAGGLAMLAISPGAPLSSKKALKRGGNPTFTSHLFVSLGLLSTLTVPLSLRLLGGAFGYSWSIQTPAVAKTVLLSATLPLLLGAGLRRARGDLAQKLAGPMSIVAQVSFAALALSVLVLAILRARVLLTSEGLAIIGLMSLLALGAMWIGHALGGPELDTRRTLAVTGAARNQGLSLLLAKVNFPNLDVLPTILGYLIACAIAYAIYARSTRDTPQAKHSARPGSHAHAHTR